MANPNAVRISQTLPTRLQKYRQRTTYEAVGGLVGLRGRGFGYYMSQLKPNHTNSWVVNKITTKKAKRGYPSNYPPSQLDPNLATSGNPIIEDTATLRKWMRTHP